MSTELKSKNKKNKKVILIIEEEEDQSEYMDEPMECVECKRTDIPRRLLKWNGGSYTDTCEECFNMNEIISRFGSKYPRVAVIMTGLNPDYPPELKLKMTFSVSLLMSKLDRGDYKKYQKNPEKITDEVVDMFGRTYIQNYCKVADHVYQALGHYNTFPKVNILDPDNFIKKLISQEAF